MCGIYGYIGKLNAIDEVYKGLKLLQYRGYDSCGIAYYTKNALKIVKAVGALENLEKPNIKCNIAFGHTRWATNGEVNLKNTHPHISYDKAFTVVHNGIINNADTLKKALKKSGVKFYSNTDTEVIANLLTSIKGNSDNKVKNLFNQLEGSFALIIGCVDKTIYLVKKFSPLNLLVSEDGIYISSDISSLPSGNLYSLQDYDIIKIKDNIVTNLNDNSITYTSHNNCIQQLSLGNFKHYMLKEIYETPFAIRKTYENICDVDFLKIFKHIKDITFIGCGTAYNSCLIGNELFKELGYNTVCELASNYQVSKEISKNHLHIIVSQSGETADCLKAAEKIKQLKGKLLIITNESKSTLTKFADYIILSKANKEMAVASTKTYCCQVFIFAYIYKVLSNKNYKLNIIDFSNKIENYIKNLDIQDIVEQINSLDKIILIGKDIDYLTLVEASLKIREIDYIFTLPIYSGELKHGTLSLIDNKSIVLALNSSSNAEKLKTAINEIESRGGKVLAFERFLQNLEVDSCYLPIYSIIPFQMISYYVAIERNLNPDMPRNLAKSVTVE